MKIAHAPLRSCPRPPVWCGAVLLLLALASGAGAQSTEIEFPTPVRTSEISGTITPRDVGDSRLTRYFYSLTGTNGDLIVTVESRNLNGDVDLFTSGGLRPLAKISMYAGEASSSSSKTIYFKRDEALILRVEARSPNDNEGSFRIRFDGAFAPFVGEAREPEPIVPAAPSTATTGKTRRVTATGARIDEPVVETAAETKPPAEGSKIPPPDAAAEKMPKLPGPSATDTEPAPGRTPRPSRTRRPRTPRASSRTARNKPAPPATTAETPAAQPDQPATTTESPATPEPAAAGPRLIIETKDGVRVERYLTSVRRVTVDNGQIVVILKSGKVERQPMTNVLKMSIEP